MKIRILDKVFENYSLDTSIEHTVIRTEIDSDDLFYIIINKLGKEEAIIDMLAMEVD